jgi:uroporphyrinogen-III synthase
MRVLVTRPKEDAIRTAEKLKRLGHESIIDSLFLIEPVEFDVPLVSFDAIAVTSANAVRIGAEDRRLAGLRSLPLFAVGAQTAEVARQAGFSKVITADGDVKSLGRSLSDQLSAGARVLYLGGENRAQDLAALVAPEGINVEMLIIYRAKAAEHFAEETGNLLRADKIDAVLHYSPRGSATFVVLAQQEKLEAVFSSLSHICLSNAVAKPLIAVGAKVKVAPRPNEEAFLDLLKK